METSEGGVFEHGKHDFDLDFVLSALKRCPIDGTDCDVREFLFAYNELCRFFKLTGTLFAFVAKDLEWKLSVIEKKLTDKQHGNHYSTVQKMVQYELNNGKTSSGSRTMLRLHWALEFILEFMEKVSHSTDHDKTSEIASDVYHRTLANHHPWFTRKMAALAMYFLPSRKDLICAMCKHDYDTVLELLEKVVQAGKQVYTIIDHVLRQNDLLNIP